MTLGFCASREKDAFWWMSKNLIHISYYVKAHHAKKYTGSSNLNEFYPDDDWGKTEINIQY